MVAILKPSAPADATGKKLDSKHRDNFDWMLRSMHLGAGGNVVGGPQSTLNMMPGSSIRRDTAGMEEEAKPFEPIAYGATLGLVYYRAIGPAARQQWDAAMQREITEGLSAHRTAMEARRQRAMQLNYVCKVPVADLLVDWLKDRIAAPELAELRAAYDLDMNRRVALFNKGWGVNPAPERDSVTPADGRAAAAQSLR